MINGGRAGRICTGEAKGNPSYFLGREPGKILSRKKENLPSYPLLFFKAPQLHMNIMTLWNSWKELLQRLSEQKT